MIDEDSTTLPRPATKSAPKPRTAVIPALDDDARWHAVVTRDATYDGQFVYAVSTTGVYCRPACPSRRANRQHVTFFRDSTAANRAGYRACKRCRPDAASANTETTSKIAAVCRAIETSEQMPKLADLAAITGLSPFHFHRVFKEATGVTPKAYGVAHRNARLRNNLKSAPTVTAAVFDAGFNSSGRFYSGAKAMLGMTPGRYKSGGAGTVLKVVVTQCSLGALLVAATQSGIAAILLGDDSDDLRRDLRDRFPNAELVGGDAAFQKIVARVTRLVERPGTSHDLPLDVRGTAFQHKVWKALQAIPPGRTASYREIAERIGSPKAVRAVAGACAANPVAVAIPCHRVVRTDGDLSGYRWGIGRKRALLDREAKNSRRKT